MSGFYLALLAVLIAGFGARDQLLLAELTKAQGARLPLLVVAVMTGLIASLAAALVATRGIEVRQPDARVWLAVFALVLAGLEVLVLRARRAASEPTHSLGAAAVVLLALQIVDASRLLIFALAIATAAPGPVVFGGALATIALLWLAWAYPERVLHPSVRLFRRIAGVVLLATALFFAMQLRGII